MLTRKYGLQFFLNLGNCNKSRDLTKPGTFDCFFAYHKYDENILSNGLK